MKRTYIKIWPLTRNYIRRCLRAVQMLPSLVSVTWIRNRAGRIKFNVRLPVKYALYPPDERKWRAIAAFSDRVLDLRTRQNRHWVTLSFILDCSRWAS